MVNLSVQRSFSADPLAEPQFSATIARDLLATTDLSAAQIARHAGYRSTQQLEHTLRTVFGGGVRTRQLRVAPAARTLTVVLPLRLPYHFDWIFGYLERRALAGMECVDGRSGHWCYRRRIGQGSQSAWVEVRQHGAALKVVLPLGSEPVHALLGRIFRVFDARADGDALHRFFCQDPQLGAVARAAPGLRVPGAWDGFETAVRAVLGQQVSVARGTELAHRMMAAYAEGSFPVPAQLQDREVAELGMPGRRGRAISALAAEVLAGRLRLHDTVDADACQRRLLSIDGIGPWTAQYVRMRVLKDPDAFPANDWVVMKHLDLTAAQARRHAQVWRPWRAYALMHLWYGADLKKRG